MTRQILAIGVVLFLAFQATADEPAPPANTPALKYDLKYKFQPNEKLRTKITHRVKVQSTIKGSSQTAETQSTSVKVWAVESVADDGNATFAHSVESIDMWQKMQGRSEIRYNSQTDQDVPPGYEEVARSVGIPLSVVTMDPKGKILKRKETRDQPTATSTQMTMPLPEQPIAVGESWTSPVDIEVTQADGQPRKIQTRQKFTLASVVDDIATIRIDSQILTPLSDPTIEAQLVQRLSDGEARFDIAAGRMLSQQLDADRNVVGFSGAASSMHYVMRFTEEMLTTEQTAARPATDAQTK